MQNVIGYQRTAVLKEGDILVNIRKATLNDYESVHKIQKQVHDIHVIARPDHYIMSEFTLDKNYFERLLIDDNKEVFVAEEDRQLVAYTIIFIKEPINRPILVPNKVVFIEDFGVHAELRRKGIGNMVFKYLIRFAKDINANSIELGVWEFNKEAIEFYETMGMQTKMRRMELKI